MTAAMTSFESFTNEGEIKVARERTPYIYNHFYNSKRALCPKSEKFT